MQIIDLYQVALLCPLTHFSPSKFGGFSFFHLLCPRKGILCALVRCFCAVPYWLNRSVMLFLARWKPEKFSILQKFEKACVLLAITRIREDEHSGFTHYCVELLYIPSFLFGRFSGPHLEDVDIQFHVSCVYIIAFVRDWRRKNFVRI